VFELNSKKSAVCLICGESDEENNATKVIVFSLSFSCYSLLLSSTMGSL
jgi:hypothetical protein